MTASVKNGYEELFSYDVGDVRYSPSPLATLTFIASCGGTGHALHCKGNFFTFTKSKVTKPGPYSMKTRRWRWDWKVRSMCPLGVFSDMYYFKVSFRNPLPFFLLFIVIDPYHHALIHIFVPCCYSVMVPPHCFSHNCGFMNSYCMLYLMYLRSFLLFLP